MLKKWTLQYFKSVYEKTTLDFAPLTIFSGANSSGKSTIIQSLLLTAQTLQNSVYDRPIILNGHIIKVGSFNDIVSTGHQQENILIGFELSSDLDTDETQFSNFTLPMYRRYNRGEFLTKINCKFEFSAKTSNDNSEILQLQPQLEECKVETTSILKSGSKDREQSIQNQSEEIYIVKTNQLLEKRLKQHKLKEEKLQSRELLSLNYEVKSPKNIKETRFSPRKYYSILPNTGNFIGAYFNHFLPSLFSIAFDTVDEETTQLLNFLILDEYELMKFSRGLGLDDYPIKKEAQNIILETIQQSVDCFKFSPKTKTRDKFLQEFDKLKANFCIENLLRCYKLMSSLNQQILRQKLEEKRDELKKILTSNQTPEYAVTYFPLPEISEEGVDYIKQFFTHFVKYLGPLRDEPKAVYSLAGTTDSKDIGFRGEHTAAVLEVHRKTKVKYIPTKQFELGNFLPEISEEILSVAVLDWLKYMGIGNNFKTSDKGVLGYELKVAISDTQAFHDLTHVGVGVSQVLPILVQSLLAERGSTLIFEQPELHLHPKVQTRLADFFISMTMLKKQCIVETHSEYLINRLRYLSVISQDNTISDNVIIYFVEKQGEKSHYRPIKINEFGVIEDWPKGFFDESEQNSRAIVKEAMNKRKALLQKNK